jgi:hypothetical protein
MEVLVLIRISYYQARKLQNLQVHSYYKCLTAFFILLLLVLDNREPCKRAHKKETTEFCRIFKQKSSIGIFSYAQIKMRHVLKKIDK